jgi:eukaryotic-like serine/threonine-protein kinase
MVLLDGGTFVDGEDSPSEGWHKAAKTLSLDSFCIDIYEYPNQKGKMPKGNVSWEEAQQLCQAQGKRLCQSAEWGRACQGTTRNKYSYGQIYEASKCNTSISGSGPGVGQPAPVKPSGLFKECKSPEGVYDLNGSLSEWVADPWSDFPEPFNPTATPSAETWRTLKGGTMWSQTFYGQDCTSRHGHHYTEWKNVDDGFRCCKDAIPLP